jgi:hypothetical protein
MHLEHIRRRRLLKRRKLKKIFAELKKLNVMISMIPGGGTGYL